MTHINCTQHQKKIITSGDQKSHQSAYCAAKGLVQTRMCLFWSAITLLPLRSFLVNVISLKTIPNVVVDPPPGVLQGIPRSHFGNCCSTCAATLPLLQSHLFAANM